MAAVITAISSSASGATGCLVLSKAWLSCLVILELLFLPYPFLQAAFDNFIAPNTIINTRKTTAMPIITAFSCLTIH